MDWLSKIISSGVSDVIDSVGKVIDLTVTSEEERLLIQKELEEIRVNAKLQATDKSIEMEKEITSRWKIDSENIVTRLIRPMTVFWSYFLFTIVLLFDGNIGEFHINQAYIPMLETILVTVTIAFFGSRGLEKVTKTVKGSELDLF